MKKTARKRFSSFKIIWREDNIALAQSVQLPYGIIQLCIPSVILSGGRSPQSNPKGDAEHRDLVYVRRDSTFGAATQFDSASLHSE